MLLTTNVNRLLSNAIDYTR